MSAYSSQQLPRWLSGIKKIKSLPAYAEAAGDAGLIPGSGKSPGEANGNPLQYSCLKNPMGRRNWWAKVHGVANSQTWLSDWAYTHILLNTQQKFHLGGASKEWRSEKINQRWKERKKANHQEYCPRTPQTLTGWGWLWVKVFMSMSFCSSLCRNELLAIKE